MIENELRKKLREIHSLREVKIKNGKFTLEDKVIDINPISLRFSTVNPKDLEFEPDDKLIISYFSNGVEESHNASREMDKLGWKKSRDYHSITNDLKKLMDIKPENVEGYVLGEPEKEYHSGGGSFPGSETYKYPILFLRFKESK